MSDRRPRRVPAVAIYGTGAGGLRLWEALALRRDLAIVGFVDGDPARAGQRLCGLPIFGPSAAATLECDVIAIASVHAAEIRERLLAGGVPASRLVEGTATPPVLDRLGLPAANHLSAAATPGLQAAVFGAGAGGLRVWERLAGRHDVACVAFLDNDPTRHGATLCGLPVVHAPAFDVASVDVIVVASVHAAAIRSQLEAMGVPARRIHTLESLLAALVAVAPPGRPTVGGPRPTVLNFQVNDICNSRCVMCNIWTRRRDRELSPEEFRRLLRDPYFAAVEHIGITGGEPTLRRDLPEFYRAAIDECPRLAGASFITHGIDTGRAMEVYPRCASLFIERRLQFFGFVSIDGVDAVHDTVRGRPGAFEAATSTLFGLKQAGVAVSACCTIVKANVWGLRDLLDWSLGKTYVRFRIAEFIARLYNEDAVHQVRAFDDAERSELISFFQFLHDSYETDEGVRRTYASIIDMVAGGARQVACPYLAGDAISIDCRGQFAICAPRGVLHPLGDDAAAAVAAAADERREIGARACASCIHDYHAPWTVDRHDREQVAAVVRHRLEGAAAAAVPHIGPAPAANRPARLLVLGWYGTETIGDLAILAALVQRHRAVSSDMHVVVPSRHPAYTRHNVRRMGLDVEVVSYGDAALLGDLWHCDTVIIGGGPLMDIPELAHLAAVLERARALGRRTIVDGCGVGPVAWPSTAALIARIGAVADVVRVRDQASARLWRQLTNGAGADVVDDPAVDWVRATGVRWLGRRDGPVCVFARELTSEYPQAVTIDEATARIVAFVQRLCDARPDRPVRLQAMHHFPVGGDDRMYARRVRALVARDNCEVDAVPRTPLETLEIMAGASRVVGMRFHSVVFADTIGAPLLAIDYTDGGKIASYLAERGRPTRRTTLAELDAMRGDALAAWLTERPEPVA